MRKKSGEHSAERLEGGRACTALAPDPLLNDCFLYHSSLPSRSLLSFFSPKSSRLLRFWILSSTGADEVTVDFPEVAESISEGLISSFEKGVCGVLRESGASIQRAALLFHEAHPSLSLLLQIPLIVYL